MQITKMEWLKNSRLGIVIVLGAVLSSLTGYVWLNVSSGSGGSNAAPITRKVKDADRTPRTATAKLVTMDDVARRKQHEQNIKSWEKVDSIAEAAGKVPFKLKSPKSAVIGEPSAMYIEDYDGLAPADVKVYFGEDPANGIWYSAEISSGAFDPAVDVANSVAGKKDGSLKADKVPYLVDVNGHAAKACEPGFNLINGGEYPRPGFILWEDEDGVVYNLIGTRGKDGTTVEELLKIARSISKDDTSK